MGWRALQIFNQRKRCSIWSVTRALQISNMSMIKLIIVQTEVHQINIFGDFLIHLMKNYSIILVCKWNVTEIRKCNNYIYILQHISNSSKVALIFLSYCICWNNKIIKTQLYLDSNFKAFLWHCSTKKGNDKCKYTCIY